MALLSDDRIATDAEKRTGYRLVGVTTKLNPQEVSATEKLAMKRGLQRGELIRQLILRELREDAGEASVRVELTEIIGLRLMLTNLLRPIATGEKITHEMFDAIMAEVRRVKREVAVEVGQQGNR